MRGIVHLDVGLRDHVAKGEDLGVMRAASGDSVGRVTSRPSGIVIGHTPNPLVPRGEAVVHVAVLPRGNRQP